MEVIFRRQGVSRVPRCCRPYWRRCTACKAPEHCHQRKAGGRAPQGTGPRLLCTDTSPTDASGTEDSVTEGHWTGAGCCLDIHHLSLNYSFKDWSLLRQLPVSCIAQRSLDQCQRLRLSHPDVCHIALLDYITPWARFHQCSRLQETAQAIQWVAHTCCYGFKPHADRQKKDNQPQHTIQSAS